MYVKNTKYTSYIIAKFQIHLTLSSDNSKEAVTEVLDFQSKVYLAFLVRVHWLLG